MTADTHDTTVGEFGSSKEKILGPGSLATLFVPIVALLVALLSGSFLLLDYVHVLSGATWTGIDLFMGLVMSRILRSLPPPSRAQFIKKLVPIMLFLMPSLASVAITAGVYVAMHLGLNFFSAPIIAAGLIVIVLSVQGFGLLLPTEIRIFLELRKQSPDTNKIIKLGMRNIYISGSQAIFQIAIIFVMAYLATM
ncbi:MAG: hypothetical protein JRN52_14350 [Nitrososphaerota archaeon]|nr:hypothetical protein [Nitrososphaerota archaeon]